jgi:phenylalanyl-tRNA synthetase alpha chain
MEQKLINIKINAIPMIFDAKTIEELEEARIQILGKSGSLTAVMKEIAGVPREDRVRIGQIINETKQVIQNAFDEKQKELKVHVEKKNKVTIDVTEPGIKPQLGHLHLITQAIYEITEIFQRVGFTRVRYPEVEWDWYAFEALNFPDNHPARDDWETFFIDEKSDRKLGPMLLTPHTSSGQVREMMRHVRKNSKSETRNPKQDKNIDDQSSEIVLNIKMLNIAKCYRRQSDVSHTPMFHQFEGLVVGKDISITHLKGTLDYFVRSYFGDKRKARIRPYHFQFTEPSFEVDVSCGVCFGKGILESGEKCRLCKSGWLELGGAGMVHPNVLQSGGINPEEYTGFAFGWGVERVLMMKEGITIDDLRLLYSSKLEFLEQF